MKVWLILLCILLLGFILRIYRISDLSLYGDELTMVYDSYSILKTGMDQTGERLPLTFRMGSGRPAGYVYGSVPFVAIFGMTALGVRTLSLLSGLGIILLTYFLGKKLFSEKVGLVASFLVALSPWGVYLSRGGFEAHFAFFLGLLGTVAFLYADKKKWLYIIWALSWGITIHTYPTFKLTLPLVFLILIWYKGEVKKLIPNKFFLTAVFLLLLFVGFSFRETFKGRSEERFLSINILVDTDIRERIIQKINNERTLSRLPEIARSIFYNKPLEYASILVESYSKNFSYDFLFLKGDGNPRHNPGEAGMLYLVEVITIFVAIANLWKEKGKILIFLIAWILIVPLAAMLIGDPHGLRNAFMLPALALLSAYGLTKVRRVFRLLLLLGVVVQFVFIFQRVYLLAPNKFARFWSYPAKVAVQSATENKDSFRYIILSDKIDNVEYAYPVYTKVDPELVIQENIKREEVAGFKFKKYDNIYIGSLPKNKIADFLNSLDGKALYIGDINEKVTSPFQEILKSRDGTDALSLIKKY